MFLSVSFFQFLIRSVNIQYPGGASENQPQQHEPGGEPQVFIQEIPPVGPDKHRDHHLRSDLGGKSQSRSNVFWTSVQGVLREIFGPIKSVIYTQKTWRKSNKHRKFVPLLAMSYWKCGSFCHTVGRSKINLALFKIQMLNKAQSSNNKGRKFPGIHRFHHKIPFNISIWSGRIRRACGIVRYCGLIKSLIIVEIYSISLVPRLRLGMPDPRGSASYNQEAEPPDMGSQGGPWEPEKKAAVGRFLLMLQEYAGSHSFSFF